MRQSKTQGTHFISSQPAPWMKPAFVVLAMLFLVAGFLLWDQWESAQADLAVQTKALKAKAEANADLKARNGAASEYLQKFSKDPDFQMKIARERLGYTAPDEIILKIEPPPQSKPAGADSAPKK